MRHTEAGTLLPFNRDGAFFHKRAAKHRDAGRWLHALYSLREAIKREPDNPRFVMDWAMFCFEQGYIEESVRALMGMLSGETLLAEAFFGLACCLYSICDYQRAVSALEAYNAVSAGQGEYAEEAQNMLNELREMYEHDGVNMIFSVLPWELLLSETMSAKERNAARQSWRLFSGSVLDSVLQEGREADAERAMPMVSAIDALMAAFKRDMFAVERRLNECALGACDHVPTLLCAAVARHLQGRGDAALTLFDAALDVCETYRDEVLILIVGGRFKQHATVYSIACDGLLQWPLNRQLLNASSVSAYYLGYDAKVIAAGWETMLKADPDDTIAQYYLTALNKGQPFEPIYEVETPPKEAARRIAWIKRMSQRAGEGADIWRDNTVMRDMCAWALRTQYNGARLAATRAMLNGDLNIACSMLRTALCDMRAPDDAKMLWVHMLADFGAKDPYVTLLARGVAMMGVQTVNTADLPPSYHRVLKGALSKLHDQYGDAVIDGEVERIWLNHWQSFDGGPNLRQLNTWSAALECLWLWQRDGEMPNIKNVADNYGEDEVKVRARMDAIISRLEQ